MALIRKDEHAKVILNKSGDAIIKLAEKEIAEHKKLLQEKLPSFKEVEEMYLVSKKEIDGINSVIEENETLLKQISNYRMNKNPDAEVRVVRTTSHLDKKPGTRMWFSYVSAGVKILEREKNFMQPKLLFDMIISENSEVLKAIIKNPTKLRVARGNFIHRWKTLSKIAAETKQGEVVIYKELYGLFRWMHPHDVKTPRPEFMKQFVFKN